MTDKETDIDIPKLIDAQLDDALCRIEAGDTHTLDEQLALCRQRGIQFCIKQFDRASPIVLLNEISLMPGWGADYVWHDTTHEVISFEFNLKPKDRLRIIYRDSDHLPGEQVSILFVDRVPLDTKFNVRTLEIVRW